jgi:hypothetical protein
MSRARLADLDGLALWSVLHDAVAGSREGLAGEVAGRCLSEGSPRLGWIFPPPWRTVERAIAAVLSALRQPEPHGVLPLATGGWSFAASAVRETVSQADPAGLLAPLDSLDPATIRRALRGPGQPPRAFLAISASRATWETRILTTVMRGHSDTARIPLVWLSDQTAIPDVLSLSPRGEADQVAMLGAPLSTAFLAAAAMADLAGLAGAYARLLRDYTDVGTAAVRRAAAVDVRGAPLIRFVPPQWAGNGLRLWLLQLGRQVLCGKSEVFRPRVDVAGPGAPDDLPDLLVDLGTPPGDLSGLMEVLYRAVVFTGCLALRASLPVAGQSHGGAYKQWLGRARRQAGPLPVVPSGDLPAAAAAWLADRQELTRLHVVRYESAATGPATASERFAAATGRACEVHLGSAWNHHSFHASYADPSVAVLVAVAPPETSAPAGQRLLDAAAAQHEIAIATHLALGDRSMIVQLPGPCGQDKG